MGPWLYYGLQALQFLSSMKAQKRQEKAQIEANKKTAQGYIQKMNYTFQNAEIQRQSAFASAVDQLTKTRLQANRQESAVLAAVSEDFQGGGRTADMVARSIRNDTARASRSILNNMEVTNNEIDINKEAALISTKNAIDSIPAVQKKSNMSYLVDAGFAYINAKEKMDVLSSLKQGRGTPNSNYTASTRDTTANIRTVDLDQYIKEEETAKSNSNFSFFSTNSVFTSNPVSLYYGGFNYDSVLLGNKKGGTNKLWGTKLLLQ